VDVASLYPLDEDFVRDVEVDDEIDALVPLCECPFEVVRLLWCTRVPVQDPVRPVELVETGFDDLEDGLVVEKAACLHHARCPETEGGLLADLVAQEVANDEGLDLVLAENRFGLSPLARPGGTEDDEVERLRRS